MYFYIVTNCNVNICVLKLKGLGYKNLRRTLTVSVYNLVLWTLIECEWTQCLSSTICCYIPSSPGILWQKVGQPATNCKRRFFNGFWSRNMSSITYQKSPKIRVGEVDEKRVFFRALYRLILRCMKTRLYVLPVVLLEFETPYSMD